MTHFGGTMTGMSRWSPDGSRIAFHSLAQGNAAVYVINAEGGEEQQILKNPHTSHAVFAWTVVEKGVYYGDPLGSPHATIQFLDFSTGHTKTVAEIKNPLHEWGLAVSPDERTVLFVQLDRSDSDIMLVDNFR